MKSLKHVAFAAMALAVTAAPALAGTKYAANLVSNSPSDPIVPPTLASKSAVKLDDKGGISVSLAGVVDGGGLPVTTSTSYNDTGTLDGSEYVAIIKMVIPGISGIADRVELPVVLDLKAGKGKAKKSAAALFAFIPPGIGRSLEIIGTEVWGPLGGPTATTCQAIVSNALPVSVVPVGGPDPTDCRGGVNFGMSGLAIP